VTLSVALLPILGEVRAGEQMPKWAPPEPTPDQRSCMTETYKAAIHNPPLGRIPRVGGYSGVKTAIGRRRPRPVVEQREHRIHPPSPGHAEQKKRAP